jgi:hypothetical protein
MAKTTEQQKQFECMKEDVFAVARMFQENEASIVLALCDRSIAKQMNDLVSDLFSITDICVTGEKE